MVLMKEKREQEEEKRKELEALLHAECSICRSGQSDFENQILFCDL